MVMTKVVVLFFKILVLPSLGKGPRFEDNLCCCTSARFLHFSADSDSLLPPP